MLRIVEGVRGAGGGITKRADSSIAGRAVGRAVVIAATAGFSSFLAPSSFLRRFITDCDFCSASNISAWTARKTCESSSTAVFVVVHGISEESLQQHVASELAILWVVRRGRVAPSRKARAVGRDQ